MRLARFNLVLISALLPIWSGCTVGPNYARPKSAITGHFSEASQIATTNSPESNWWKSFHDPELDRLITEALKQNYNLKAAYARVRQSRLQRTIVAADLFPQVDADAGYVNSRGSKNVTLPFGGSGGGSAQGGTTKKQNPIHAKADTKSAGDNAANDSAFDNQLTPFGKGGLPGVDTDLCQAGFDASWEIDVFGAKRRQVEAASADFQAAIEKRRDVTLTLMSEVARNYFQLRGAQERLNIARKNLDAQNEILELTRSRSQTGLATDADVARAAAEAATTSAVIPSFQAQIRLMIHALSVLIAQQPTALEKELSPARALPGAPPVIPMGLPSQLVERRPDVRAAERGLAAAHARIGSAKADLFPKFALIASAGLDSSSINNLFQWESRYFLVSPTVTWRIFDAGRIISNIRLQQALTVEADMQFQSVVLQAFQEVEDGLVNFAMERERLGRLQVARDQNQLGLQLVRQRYEHGLATFLEVLDAERTAEVSEDSVAESNLAEIVDLVVLYKSLGGGWQVAANQ